ncbi:MAG: response regulator [Candidatus Firestonebacteria bacterium]
MEKKYKTKDLCLMFNVSRETVSNWVQAGKIKSAKTAGGHMRFEREAVHDFAAECKLAIKKHGPRRFRVLVVADREPLLRLLKKMFNAKAKSIDIETAVNGLEAGIKLAELFPDLVILDTLLPGVKGLDVLRIVRDEEKFRKIKILAHTASVEEAEKMIKAGADRTLVKTGNPNEPEHLFNMTKELLGRIR